MSQELLHLKDVCKSFSLLHDESLFSLLFTRTPKKSNIAPLHHISLSLKRGEIIGILGKNGSGKTTLCRIISGIYKQDSGIVISKGKVITVFALRSGFNPALSGRENIYLKAALYGMTKNEVAQSIETIINFSELNEFIDKPLGIYSAGMKAKLGFAIITQAKADIMIIDEALAVGDKAFRKKCFDYLKSNKETCSVLYITHSHEHLENFADRFLLLDQGSFCYESTSYAEAIEKYDNLAT